MNEAGLSASQVRQAHQVLHTIFTAAVENSYVVVNAADGAALPRI